MLAYHPWSVQEYSPVSLHKRKCLWKTFAVYPLTINIRSSEKKISNFLMSVGDGTLGSKISIPKGNVAENVSDLIHKVSESFLESGCSHVIAKSCVLNINNQSYRKKKVYKNYTTLQGSPLTVSGYQPEPLF